MDETNQEGTNAIYIVIQTGLLLYSHRVEDLSVSIALILFSVLLHCLAYRHAWFVALPAAALSLLIHYYWGIGVVMAVTGVTVLLVAITLLLTFVGRMHETLYGISFWLIIVSVALYYVETYSPDIYVNLFWGYWMWLPLIVMLLQYADERFNPAIRQKKAELKAEQVELDAHKTELARESDALTQEKEQFEERSKNTLKDVVSQIEQALSTNTDSSNTKSEPKKKWMTLDEQHEYLDGLQEYLESRYHKEVVTRYQRDDVLNLSLSDQVLSLTYGTDTNLLDVKRDTLKRLRNFQTYSRQLFQQKEAQFKFQNIQAGIRGEEVLEEELALISDNFEYLSNVRVEIDDVSAESDALIFSPRGIFTIEAKNFGEAGSYSIHISKDGKWTRIYDDRTEPMKDVVAQNNRHVLAKEKLLNRTLKDQGLMSDNDYVEINGLIVITNDVVDIQNESDFPVMRLSHLHSHIRKHKSVYTKKQLEIIHGIFKEANLPPLRFPLKDFEAEYEQAKSEALPLLDAYQSLIELDSELNDAHMTFTDRMKTIETNLQQLSTT